MSELEVKERSITPSYIEYTIFVGNQMSSCPRAVGDMLAVWGIWKKNTLCIRYIIVFISSIFKMPALVKKLHASWWNQDMLQGWFTIYFFIFYQRTPPLSKNGTLTGPDFICQSFFTSRANDLSVNISLRTLRLIVKWPCAAPFLDTFRCGASAGKSKVQGWRLGDAAPCLA